MASDIFKEAMERVPRDHKKFISNSFEINNYIHQVLKEKGLTQKYLAQKLGKSESEISKILSPGYNLTLRTLSKIEVALEVDIVEVPKSKEREGVNVYFELSMDIDIDREESTAKIVSPQKPKSPLSSTTKKRLCKERNYNVIRNDAIKENE